MAKYILTEDQLESLLQKKLELEALPHGGVDNWDWYGDSLHEHPDWNNDTCEFNTEEYFKKYPKLEEK